MIAYNTVKLTFEQWIIKSVFFAFTSTALQKEGVLTSWPGLSSKKLDRKRWRERWSVREREK